MIDNPWAYIGSVVVAFVAGTLVPTIFADWWKNYTIRRDTARFLMRNVDNVCDALQRYVHSGEYVPFPQIDDTSMSNAIYRHLAKQLGTQLDEFKANYGRLLDLRDDQLEKDLVKNYEYLFELPSVLGGGEMPFVRDDKDRVALVRDKYLPRFQALIVRLKRRTRPW